MEINELCYYKKMELEIRNSERRPHVIEDAPSRKAPNSSEEIKIGKNWIKLDLNYNQNFKE